VVRARVRRAKATGVESDGDGAFELCVPPGEAVLYVDADGYGAVRVAVLVLGRTLRDVVLTPQATIVGRVVDESGAPVPSGLVWAVPDQYLRTDSGLAGATLSGTDGCFVLPIAAGNYRVMARAAGSATTAPVFVAAIVGRLSDEVVLRLISGTLVRGHVRAEGKPVAGAKWRSFALQGAHMPSASASSTGVSRFRASSTAGSPYASASGKPHPSVALADGSSRVDGVRLAINYERKAIRGRVVDVAGDGPGRGRQLQPNASAAVDRE
jgi:hypothetical protein